jgi:hypothetical protein
MTEADGIAGRLEAEFVRRTGKSPDEASSEELRAFLETMEAEADGDRNSEIAPAAPPKPAGPAVHLRLDDPKEWKGEFRAVGGSLNDPFNNLIVDQTAQSLWIADLEPARRDQHFGAAMAALAGTQPQSEIEGMVAAQMVAAHAATMECYRRAMVPTQTTEVRAMNLSMANKSSRTFAALLEALNRHRGKGGKQTVRVEHVHVHAGGQAVVGVVDTQGGEGHGGKNAKQPHARQIAHAPEPAMSGSNTFGHALPAGSDEERTLPDARWPVTGRTEGEPQRLEAGIVHGPREGGTATLCRDDAGNAEADQDG